MTEIEQLKADLATIQEAANIAKKQGFHDRTGNYDMVEGELKQKIADLEAQQEQADKWADSRMFVREILADSSFPQRLIWLARYARHLEAKVAELDHELRCEQVDGGKVRDDRKNQMQTKKWVEITEDPSTWPEMNRLLITRVTSNVAQETNACQLAVAQSLGLSLEKYGREFLKFYQLKGVFWRESIQQFEIIEPVGYGIANVSHWMYVESTSIIANRAISAEKKRQKLAELTTILNAIPPACGLARELVERRIESVKKEMQGNV